MTAKQTKAIVRCLKAYTDHAVKEKIVDICINRKGGYLYLKLDNGIRIAANIQ